MSSMPRERWISFLMMALVLLAATALSTSNCRAQGDPAERAANPEGYADHLCESPQNLTGTVLLGDSTGLNGGHCSLVWDGSAYGATWVILYGSEYRVMFARIAADGTLLMGPTTVSAGPDIKSSPSIAWSGNIYGIAWYEDTTQQVIFFAQVSASGTKIGSDTPVSVGALLKGAPCLVWAESHFGVAWSDARSGDWEIYFAPISETGTPGTEVAVTAADGKSSMTPSLTAVGTGFGVSWEDDRHGGGNWEIYFARLSSTGAKIGFELRVTNDSAVSRHPSLVWTGTQYALAWEDARTTVWDIYFARISSGGSKLGSDLQITSDAAESNRCSLVWTGSEFGVAWLDTRNGGKECFFARITQAGVKTGSDLVFTYNGGDTPMSALAFGTLGYGLFYQTPEQNVMGFTGIGCHFGSTAPSCPTGLAITGNSSYGVSIAWEENGVDRDFEIAYHRVYRNGSPIGETTERSFTDTSQRIGTPTYRVVAVNANGWESSGCPTVTAPVPTGDCGEPWIEPTTIAQRSTDGDNPSMAWDGAAYGVVWEEGNKIVFARISSDGAVLVPAKQILAIGLTYGYPSLVWAGSNYGLAWTDVNGASRDIFFERLDLLGNVLGLTEQISSSATPHVSSHASLAWTGIEYGVVWDDTRSTTKDLYFANISDGGLKAGSDIQVTSAAGESRYPSLVWTGSRYAVAWEDTRNTHSDIYKTTIDPLGMPGTAIQISTATTDSLRPSLAWTGTELGLAWEDTRSTYRHIYFARVSEIGGKQGSEVQVTDAYSSSTSPNLVWTGSEYGVAWKENRDGDDDIYYATLNASGYKLGGDRNLSQDAMDEGVPSMAVGGRGLGLVFGTDADDHDVRFAGLGCGSLDTSPPPCPSSPAETGRTSDSVTLAWGPSFETGSDFGHYAIYKDGVEAGATVNTGWTDTDFDPAAGPVYHVLATNAAGYPSAACSSVQTADHVAPTCPSNLSFEWIGVGDLQLFWMPSQDALSGVKQYHIYKNDIYKDTVGPGETSYLDSMVYISNVYRYEVIAEDWAGNFSSGCAFLSTADTVPPTCPTGLSYQWYGPSQLLLSWFPSQEIGWSLRRYMVYRDDSDPIEVDEAETTYVDNSVTPSFTHHYTVLAEDWAGNLSAGCASISTEDVVPPPCPQSLQATAVSGTFVTLKWIRVADTESDVKQYKVYRDAAFLADVSAIGAETYTDSTVVSGHTYIYTVLAEDWAGNLSSGCAAISVTTPDPQDPCGVPWTENALVAVSQGFGLSGSPSAAWDGSAYGIVWQDDLSDNLEIFFARVSPDGAVIVPPTRITNDAAASEEPSIAWNGSEFGVAWQDARTTTTDIYFARIGTDGAKIGSDVQITNATGSSLNPSIVWTGTEYGLVWDDTRTTVKDLYFVRLSATGTKLDADIQITSDAASSVHPSLVWTGSGYGLAWEDNRDGNTEIYFARISAGGTKLGSDTRITNATGVSEYPSLAWTGSNYGVAWKDARTTSGDIYLASIGAAGAKSGSDIQVTSDASLSYEPSLAWLGSQFGLAWRDNRSGRMDVWYTSLDADGLQLGTQGDLSGGEVEDYRPALVAGGGGYALVYRANVSGDADEIRFVGMGCGAPDTTPPPCPSNPAVVARTSTSVTLAWGPSSDPDGEFGHYAIYKDGAPFAATLETVWTDTAFDPAAGPVYHVVATNAAGIASAGCPAVATADVVPPPCPAGLEATAVSTSSVTLSWLAAQDPESGLKQYKVYRDATLLGNVAAGTQTYTDAAVLPGAYYAYGVLSEDWAGNLSAGCASLLVSAVDSDACGEPWTGSAVVAASAGLGLLNPAAAWDGAAYGLVWQDNLSGNWEIFFARVAPDGTVLVPAVRLTNATGDSVAPAIAWDGSEFGVAWQDARTTTTDIYYTRVDTLGNKIGSDVQVTSDAGMSLDPSIVWTGTEFGLAWEDTRTTVRDLYFARLTPAGSKLETERQITTDAAISSQASLVWTGSGYGLAWLDTRDGNPEIYFARIYAAGTKVGSDTRISNYAGTSETPTLVWMGSGYGVAWRDFRTTGGDIYFARISEAGARVGGEVQVTSDASTSHESSLVWMGSEFLLAWRDDRSGRLDIYTVSLDAAGAQLGAPRNLSGGDVNNYTPALVRGAKGAALVYQADITGTADEIRFVGLGCGEPDATPPPCPADPVLVARSSTSVTLAWGPTSDPESDFGHYIVTKNGAQVAVTSETTWTDTSFDPAASPVYRILATNAAGAQSTGCPAVPTADTGPPTCPGNLLATSVSSASVTLAWLASQDAGSGLKQYGVYRDDILLMTLPDGTTTFTDIAVAAETTYSYSVLAEDLAGNLSAGCASLRVTASDGSAGSSACAIPWTPMREVTQSTNAASAPSVVWDGAAYGVAWMDNRDGNYEIYFARVSTDGAMLVPPTRISNDAVGSFCPSLVWTGSEYGVAWYDQRTPTYDIYFARIGIDGSKIGSDNQITTDPADSTYPSLVWTGTEYGVAWKDTRAGNSDIYFARISATGAKIASDVQITNDPGQVEMPSLVWADSQYGVAWYDTRSTGRDIYFALISSAGVKTTLDIQITDDPDDSYGPSLAWTGSEFGVAWYDTRGPGSDIYFARISALGVKESSDIPVTTYPNGGREPNLVWNDAGYSLSWEDSRTGSANIFVASLDASGAKIGTERNLSTSGTQNTASALARGGQGLAVVYREDLAGDKLHFVGLGCGEPDATPPPCPSSPTAVAQTSNTATLAWGPSSDPDGDFGHYAIYKDGVLTASTLDTTWTDISFSPAARPVYHILATNAAGVASAGCPAVTVGEETPIPCGEAWTGAVTLAASSWAEAPSAVWDGQAYGVVWRDDRDGNAEIYFARVTAAGAILVPASRVTFDASFSQSPTIAWDGSAYGIVWTDGRTTTTDIYFTRMSTAGNKLMGDIQITSDASISDSPSLVWTGSEFGVAWTDNRLGNPEIYFARIDAYGTKLSSDIELTALGGSNTRPSLVYTGNQYGLAWVGTAAGSEDIYFARVSNYGIKIGADVRVTSDPGSSRYPSLVWTGAEYGLSYDDDRYGAREILFVRISSGGSVQGTEVRVSINASASDAPSLVWKDGEYLVAWSDWRMGRPEVYAASLSPAGAHLGGERRLTSSYDDDVQVRLAPSGHGAGLLYKTVLDTHDQIRFLGLGCGSPDTTPPACPGYLSITEKNSMMLTLGWMASAEAGSDFSHYTIYKDGAVAATTQALTWTDWSFNPGAGSVYLVTATNAAALESANCAVISTTDATPPTCVDGLQATVSSGPMVMLTWISASDTGSGIYEYRIYRNGMFIGSRMPGANMYMDMPDADSTYAYIVEAVDYAGNSSSGCSAVWVYTGPIQLRITKNADNLNASLDWNDVGLSQYVVYRSASPQVDMELKRVALSETQDPVLQDGVRLWFYIIQQRE